MNENFNFKGRNDNLTFNFPSAKILLENPQRKAVDILLLIIHLWTNPPFLFRFRAVKAALFFFYTQK